MSSSKAKWLDEAAVVAVSLLVSGGGCSFVIGGGIVAEMGEEGMSAFLKVEEAEVEAKRSEGGKKSKNRCQTE